MGHQAPEYRDQTLDHMTLVDRIYNVNNAIFALYIHVIICLGQKKLVDFVVDTLYIHVLYTLTSRRLYRQLSKPRNCDASVDSMSGGLIIFIFNKQQQGLIMPFFLLCKPLQDTR